MGDWAKINRVYQLWYVKVLQKCIDAEIHEFKRNSEPSLKRFFFKLFHIKHHASPWMCFQKVNRTNSERLSKLKQRRVMGFKVGEKIDKQLLLSAYTEELYCLISMLRLIIKFLAWTLKQRNKISVSAVVKEAIYLN